MKPTFETAGIKLYLGDCMEILPTLTGIDAVITDPPYGIGKWSSGGGNSITKEQAENVNGWDIVPSAENLQALVKMANVSVVWGGNYLMGILGASRAPLIWDKAIRGMHFADGEMAWTNFDWGTLRILNYAIAQGDTYGAKLHPTQKPIRVMEWSMAQAKLKEGAIVLDAYMGSGTTGIACIRTGRNFIGIEKDPAHFATALDRIQRELAQGVFQFEAPKPQPTQETFAI